MDFGALVFVFTMAFIKMLTFDAALAHIIALCVGSEVLSARARGTQCNSVLPRYLMLDYS